MVLTRCCLRPILNKRSIEVTLRRYNAQAAFNDRSSIKSASAHWDDFFSSPWHTRLRAKTGNLLKTADEVEKPGDAAVPVQSQKSISLSVRGKSTEALLAEGWRPISSDYSLSELWTMYKALSKAKLAALVVLTAMAGYAMCPVDPASASAATEAFLASLPNNFNITMADLGLSSSPSSDASTSSVFNSLSLPRLVSTTVGTMLCISSANAYNQSTLR